MIWPFLPGGVAQTVVAAVPNTAKIASAANVRMSAPFVPLLGCHVHAPPGASGQRMPVAMRAGMPESPAEGTHAP